MKRQRRWMLAAILMLSGLSICFSSCDGSHKDGIALVAGTLESPLEPDTVPSRIMKALEQAERYHQFEIMSDTVHDISVEAIGEADTTSTEGFGIVVMKGAVSTKFLHLRNARNNTACYDAESGVLWLTSSAMWGTGVQVDWLYQLRFDSENKASITHTVNPYDLQQQLCRRLGYSIEGQQVTFYDGAREITNVTNTVTDMGGFDDELPVWIGEQITYDLSGTAPRLLVTPGINFTTGLVLTYDDMPTLSMPLTIAEDGAVTLGDIEAVKQ